jgi:hypothetical protein
MQKLMQKLMLVVKRRGNPDRPPSLTSDAAKGYESALIKVYGIVTLVVDVHGQRSKPVQIGSIFR